MEVPLAEISGVWKATRIAMLFGPMPAIWAYRRVSDALDASRPAARRALLSFGNRMYDLVRMELDLEDDFPGDGKLQPGLEAGQNVAFKPGRSFDGEIPLHCLRIYRRILNDSRLRRHKMKDSAALLTGDLNPSRSNLSTWYKEYQEKYGTIMKISKGW